jgi:hypothetical protein
MQHSTLASYTGDLILYSDILYETIKEHGKACMARRYSPQQPTGYRISTADTKSIIILLLIPTVPRDHPHLHYTKSCTIGFTDNAGILRRPYTCTHVMYMHMHMNRESLGNCMYMYMYM